MKPDADMAATSVMRLERVLEERGWDRPPALAALYLAPPSPPEFPHWSIGGAEAPTFTEALRDVGTDVALRAIAGALMDPKIARSMAVGNMRGRFMDAPFCGVAVGSESYYETFVGTSRAPALLRDSPGAVETRTMLALDTTGRVTVVSRVRASGVAAMTVEPGGDVKIGGRLLARLRDIALPIAAFVSEENVDLVAMSTCVTLDVPGRDLVLSQEVAAP